MKKIILPLILLLAYVTAISQNPLLLKDVYPGATGSGIQQIVKTSNYTFFNAEDDDPDTNRGLYRTDGTTGGTIKLNLSYLPDPPPSPNNYASTKAEKLTALGNKIIFAGDNFPNYGEIWASDGTQSGTIAIERFQPTAAGVSPIVELNKMGSYVYYSAINSSNQAILKRTDGTVAGTSEVYNFSAYAGIPEVVFLTPINNVLYFIVYDVAGTGNDYLWRSDGTTAGTYMVFDFTSARFVEGYIMPMGNNFYIMIGNQNGAVRENTIWKSDGTTGGTVPLKLIGTNIPGPTVNNIYPPFAVIGSTLYFAGLDGNGKELWKTDGTAAGTVMVADINAGSASSNPLFFSVLNNNLYFAATTVAEGTELWKYDGITASLVKDINPGTANSAPGSLVVSDNTVIFRATTLIDGSELWITDGTTANTLPVTNINPGAASSLPNLLTPGNPVYFTATNGVKGAEIFRFNNPGILSNTLYVNDGSLAGDIYTSAIGSNSNNGSAFAPYATIQYAIDNAQPGDVIYVDAGTYAERILVNKALSFKGAYAGTNPGTSLNRGASESILLPSIENNLLEIITVQAAGVSFDGFLFDGDNPAIIGSITLNGVDVNAGMAIGNANLPANNLLVKNNICKNFFRYGIFLQKTTSALTGINISQNRIDNVPSRTPRDGRAVGFFNNVYGTVSNNRFTRVNTGFLMANYTIGSADSVLITSNIIEAYSYGVNSSFNSNITSSVTVENNQCTLADLSTWSAPGSSLVNNYTGIGVNNLTSVKNLAVNNNLVTGARNGIYLSAIVCPQGIQVNGGNVSNSTQIGLFYINSGAGAAKLTMSNVSLVNNVVGLDASAADNNTMQLEFSGVTINGGTTGIRFYGAPISLPLNKLSGVSFLNQSKEYILQTYHAFEGQTIDASIVSFDGLIPTNMTLAQLFATEDKLTHKIDFDSVGYFKLKPTEVFVTVNSFAADLPPVFGTPTTTPNINRAVAAAAAADIINIAAGTYINQVTIDKGITIKGAGSALTSILTPAVTVPPPGPFTEKGIIQTAQNIADVFIEDLSITGDYTNNITPLIIQTGGHVKNCNLQNGNQGIFFRVEFATKNVLAENNIINAEYIGVNCAGLGLTATLVNNTINVNNPGFSSGVFVGQDFGSLPQFTAIGNIINNFSYTGLSVNSLNANITQNNIVGINGFAVQRTGGNLPNATCNWFGSAEAAVVKSKINGTVNYKPWLISGTDNDAVAPGFQPIPGTCTGRQNKFYVNNNSLTGDVFTTAVGNNANDGLPASPFATPDYAYSIAQAGDSIYVDAGTYDLGGLTYSFPKPMVFLGTNYQVSPNDPANKLLLNTARNAESILANGKMLIASNGLSIEGFTWDVGNRTGVELLNSALTNNDFGNFRFTKNIYKITHTTASLNSFSITGKFVNTPALPITSGYTIEDNRFEKSGSASGNTFNFNYVKNISVIANSFVVTGTTFRTQQAVNLGGAGLVDAFAFSNNLVNEGLVAVGGNRITSAIISGNKIDNTNIAFNNANSITQSSNIEISNNSMDNTTGGSAFILYNRTGTSLAGTSNVLKLENNIMTGIPLPGLAGQLFGSMNFTFSNTILNPSVIIKGNKITYSGDFSLVQSNNNRPISLRGNIASVAIENNELRLDNTGGMLPPPTGDFVINPGITINTEFFGNNMPSNAVINILNNKVHGFKQSVAFFDPNNSVNNPYIGYGNIPIGATVNINNNSFTGDSISINSGAVGEIIEGTCNWYGSSAEQNVSPKITETTVNYIPWLTNGTDNDVAVGFQPVANSCTGVPVDADIILVTNVTCYSAANGSIDALVEEGVAPFTYAWSKDGVAGYSTTEDLNNLAPGLYQLIVTDANGSVDTVFATITQPDELLSSATGTNASCFGNSNGTAAVNATGGTAPYTYLWSNAATTSSISGLVAGAYSVTVTDAKECTTTASYTVTQPSVLTLVMSGTNASCFGNSNGTATANASGGKVPYTYLWSNAATTSSISGLVAGNYSVIITDANGCTTTSSYTVTQPTILIAVVSGTNVSCFGGSNGTASVIATGGTAPHTYLWSNAATTSSISSLVAGNYSVTVTDAKECTTTGSYTVTQPTILIAVVSGTNVSCFGGSNGTASVIATGGTAPYTYLWSNAATTSFLSGLVAGNYSVTVTDANECTTTGSYTVTQPTALTVVMSGTNASCNGSATATPAGGTAPYTYNWSNGGTTQTINGIPNGTYTVIVTDAHNCTVTGTRTITGNSPINPSTTVINVSCFGGSDGKITVTGAGGTAPHTYSINGSAYQSNNVFANLSAGVYVVSVKDASGCYDFVSKTITQPTALTVVLDSTNATCFGTNNGRIYITANGGSGAKTYNWTGPNGYASTTQDPNNLFGGNYSLLVTDTKGCTAGLAVIVIERPAINISEVITHVGCRGDLTGAINATVTGGSGSGFTYKWTGPNGFLVTTEDVTGIKAGNYTFTVTDNANGCAVVKVIVVTQPATNVDVATAKTNVTGCNSLGTITATGSGGTSPYQYKLDNGGYQTSGSFTNLYGGTYTVWVKDANGCTTSKVVTITDNGTDEYEGNNSKNQAKLINIGAVVNARIALASDPADWFKFVTPAGTGNYILSLTHPAVTFTFNMYAAGNNTPALVPVNITATSKEYVLNGNSTYYVSVTGGLSYICYDMMVTPPTSFTRTTTPEITKTGNGDSAVTEKDKPVVIQIADPSVKAYPNPHQGAFNLQIASAQTGTAKIELFTITGQRLQEKTVSIQKSGNNIVPFTVAHYGTILYRVHIGDKIITGKVLSMN